MDTSYSFVPVKIPEQLLRKRLEVLLSYICADYRKLISAHPVCRILHP